MAAVRSALSFARVGHHSAAEFQLSFRFLCDSWLLVIDNIVGILFGCHQLCATIVANEQNDSKIIKMGDGRRFAPKIETDRLLSERNRCGIPILIALEGVRSGDITALCLLIRNQCAGSLLELPGEPEATFLISIRSKRALEYPAEYWIGCVGKCWRLGLTLFQAIQVSVVPDIVLKSKMVLVPPNGCAMAQ